MKKQRTIDELRKEVWRLETELTRTNQKLRNRQTDYEIAQSTSMMWKRAYEQTQIDQHRKSIVSAKGATALINSARRNPVTDTQTELKYTAKALTELRAARSRRSGTYSLLTGFYPPIPDPILDQAIQFFTAKKNDLSLQVEYEKTQGRVDELAGILEKCEDSDPQAQAKALIAFLDKQ